MNYRKQFRVGPGSRIRRKDFDRDLTDKCESKKSALREIEKRQQKMGELQFRLYAEGKRSLLVWLQGPDAGGKDAVVRHVVGHRLRQSSD